MRTKKRHYPARSDALKIIGYIDPSDLDWNPRPSGPGDTRTINVRSTPAVKCISPIVLEVCARAKTSKRDADIARLQAALAEIELGIDALSDEDDDGRRIPAREMKRQALEVIRSEIKDLKGVTP